MKAITKEIDGLEEERVIRRICCMFITRLISGVILVLLSLITVIAGGPVLAVTLLLISIIGMYELYRIFKIEQSTLGIVGYIAAMIYYCLIYIGKTEYIVLLLVIALLAMMAIYVFSFPEIVTEQVLCAFFGLFYVAVLMSYLYQARTMEDGAYVVWLIFISSWGCDTFAYCVGMLIGEHQMAPKLSPKKSIEGGIGGIVGAALLGAIYGAIFQSHMVALNHAIIQCAIICAVSGAISQIGDLAASAIKRNHNIKDYGKLIPGHGGVLDRFDSILFTAPIIFYLASWMVEHMN